VALTAEDFDSVEAKTNAGPIFQSLSTACGCDAERADAPPAESSKEVMRMSLRVYRAGEIVPISGQYGTVTVQGTWAGREVTCVKGEHFPPTRTGEAGYVLRDATIHRH
jgi:hypothetical protein